MGLATLQSKRPSEEFADTLNTVEGSEHQDAHPNFQGTSRFRVIRRLGSGGMGVVYEVYDRDRRERVALKTLNASKPRSLRFLKREFRTLAELRHKNLARLYELIEDDGQWFFTMELIQGVNWLEYVRHRKESTELGDVEPHKQLQNSSQRDIAAFRRAFQSRLPFNEERLRTSLRQLVRGLNALHREGKLHCDVKPSNVLVTEQGRVVLLDFGLVTQRDSTQTSDLATRTAIGTPAYMSPEQAKGRPLTAASDLYSVGVFLYRGLTGTLPFRGSPKLLIKAKTRLDASPPSQTNRDVPPDLDDLCLSLLSRDPQARPTARQVLRRLATVTDDEDITIDGLAAIKSSHPPMLIGRSEPLDELRLAFDTVSERRPVLLIVEGPSGIGKTWLVNQFLDLMTADQGVLALRGSCHEQESVSYKAFDAVMDEVTKYLASLDQSELTALLPPRVTPLSRLFPVLLELEVLREMSAALNEQIEPFELRRIAFGSLKELFCRLAQQKRVIISIDDLQRSDKDSLALLGTLLSSPTAPGLLLVATLRGESSTDGELSAVIRRLEADGGLAVQRLKLAPLSPAASRKLAELLMPGLGPKRHEVAEIVATRAEGNPFFIEQLAQHVSVVSGREQRPPALANEDISITQLIESRLDRLEPPQRRLLEIVAIADHPITRSTCTRAAELEECSISTFEQLRDDRLILLRGGSDHDEIDIYHDHIRFVATSHLDTKARCQRHLALARALEAEPDADTALLAVHYAHGGEPERGRAFATRAADQARDALAFDKAARLYSLVLELGGNKASEKAELKTKLGNALASSGRGAEAARAYLDAAAIESHLRPPQSSEATRYAVAELERLAADQLLRGGHVDEGLELLERVLARIGVTVATSPSRAVASLLTQRARVRLRGYQYKPRSSAELSRDVLMRLDSLWSAALGLVQIDPIRASDFQTRHLLLALETGEPTRVARAMAFEAGYLGAVRYEDRARCYKLIAESTLLAERYRSPEALGTATLADGMTSYMLGRWRLAQRFCQRAEQIFREQCVGAAWEINTAQIYTNFALFFLGEFRELAKRQPELLARARERNNLLAILAFQTATGYAVQLAADRPKDARHDVEEALERWSRKGFHMEHWWLLIARTQIDLYEGRPLVAWRRLKRSWPALSSSQLLRMQMIDVHTSYLRAMTALGASSFASRKSERWALRRDGERFGRRLAKMRIPLARGMAIALEAGLTAQRGDLLRAANLLVQTEKAADSLDMPIFAAAARHRRGLLLAGDRGAELKNSAVDALSNRGVVNPQAMIQMIAPGWLE